MPQFTVMSLEDVKAIIAPRRVRELVPYIEAIEQLYALEGEARDGKITASPDETPAVVARHLKAAAKQTGRKLTFTSVDRVGGVVYFGVARARARRGARTGERRGVGRPRGTRNQVTVPTE